MEEQDAPVVIRYEVIKCPECGVAQRAQVTRHPGDRWPIYLHECECGHLIVESEWVEAVEAAEEMVAESAEEPEPTPTWSRPRALTELQPIPLPWTQIAHVAARLWLNDIEIAITKCDTKKATADVLSLQNEWTKQHWTECIRVGGRYQVKGCWFEIETMSVVNSTLTIAPSGPPRPMQLALQLKEMGATLGVGEPDEEPDEEAAEEVEAPAIVTCVTWPSPQAGGPVLPLEGSEGAG